MSSEDAKSAEARAIALLAEFVEVSKAQQLRAHYEIPDGEPGAWLGVYPWQRNFHNAGSEFKDRAIIAANQCISPTQIVPTVTGDKRAGEIVPGDMLFSYDRIACETKPAVVSEVFCKPHEYLVRVFFSNGETLEAAAAHHLLTTQGWKSVASCIRHREDEQGLRKAHVEDDVRWLQTVSGSQVGCPVCHRCGDVLLPYASIYDQDVSPSQADVEGLDYS